MKWPNFFRDYRFAALLNKMRIIYMGPHIVFTSPTSFKSIIMRDLID